MPPKSKSTRQKTVTFNVVHRSHQDPLYHDPDASVSVLVPINKEVGKEQKRELKEVRRAKKKAMEEVSKASNDREIIKEKGETASETNDGTSAGGSKVVVFDNADDEEVGKLGMRKNEGEAALYGIQFDDSNYDYMQHLKPIGMTKDAVFISKKDETRKNQNKIKGVLFKSEYARKNNIKNALPEDVFPSATTVPRNFESEQNIPESIQGFNPDMDPRLREVLEALEDEEYVTDAEDDGNEDLFNELLAGGEASEDDYYDDDDEYYDEDDDFYDGQVSDMGEEEEEEEFKQEQHTQPKATASKPTSEKEPTQTAASTALKNDSKVLLSKTTTKEGFEQAIDAPEMPEISEEQIRTAGLPSLDDTNIPEVPSFIEDIKGDDATEQDWERAFRDFKIDQSKSKKEAGYGLDSEMGDGRGGGAASVMTSRTRATNVSNKTWRRTKNKVLDQAGRRVGGDRMLNSMNSDALTEMTGLSMSSSAVYRNKHLTLLDDRFETIEEEYLNDQDEDENNDDSHIKYGAVKRPAGRKSAHKQKEAFDMSKERGDFESILDDFLDNHIIEGRRYMKK